MKIGARSCLKGTIVDVANGQTTAHVRIHGGSTVVAAAITNEAADELRLEAGKPAYVVLKASDVMVAMDD